MYAVISAGEIVFEEKLNSFGGNPEGLVNFQDLFDSRGDSSYLEKNLKDGLTINFDYNFTRVELSQDYLKSELFDELIEYTLFLSNSLEVSSKEFVVLAKEFALSMVPMKPTQREYMRRMVKLNDVIISRCETFRILLYSDSNAYLNILDN